jgi:hypothetical protein
MWRFVLMLRLLLQRLFHSVLLGCGLLGLAFDASSTEAAQLTLRWTDSSTNESGFYIERAPGTSSTFTRIAVTAASVTLYVDTGLTSGSSYCYRVQAYNSVGASAYTNTACATTSSATTYSLTTIKGGTGSGGVTSSPTGITCGATCTASYTSGTAVTLTATPATGSIFTGWSDACSGTGTCSVTLAANTAVTATFAPQTYSLAVTRAGTGSGGVASSPTGITCGATCTASYTSGTAVTLTATPATGSTFTGWSGACSGAGTCSVTLTANTAVAATFSHSSNLTGLVAAYGFNEGSGATVTDASGNGNTGFISAAAWTTGKFGKALSFNGSTTLVSIADSASLDLTTGMTLEAWVYPTALGDWRDLLYKGPNDLYYLMGSSPSNNTPAMGGTFTSSPLYGSSALPLNTWSHIAATYDGATKRLYLNGVPVASQAQTGLIKTSTGALTIGGDPLYGQYWAGLIDEVRVYNRALSPSDIQTDMATAVGYPPPPVAAYGFNEGSGATVTDTSGNGNTGFISAAAWTTGKFGKALSFNGSTTLVSIADSASLDLTTGMTLEAWVYPTSLGNWRDLIYKGPDDIYYLSGSSTSNNAPAMGGTFTSSPLYGSSALPLNTWSHIAATYDGATKRLYLNGVPVASQAQTGLIQTSTGALTIGGDPLYGQYWAGLIDEVRVYNRALSPSDIQTDMATAVK